MPVKIYVSHDAQGRTDPAIYVHENEAIYDLIKRLWLAFHHQETLYTVIVNLPEPPADLIVISERGVGVIELKHYPGQITQKREGSWYAGQTPIKAGSENQGYRNPHDQVQAYAARFREKLMDAPLRAEPWLPGRRSDWAEFKFGTAVCFSHPEAIIDYLQKSLRLQRPSCEREIFRLLKPEDVPTWAASLTFETEIKQEHRFIPARLTPSQVLRIVTQLLKVNEWVEIVKLMPTAEPYAYLNLIENGVYTITFSLVDRGEEIIIGRNSKCGVLLPERFQRVSREHAKITRTVEGIFIEDLNSQNGIYINGQRLEQKGKLKPGQQITLGGPSANSRTCLLEFSLQPKAVEATTSA
ncbi:MAG: FHA domain-containing protein [Anaerolineales bacterium]|nr:FHA domain-containing protein [Anaerolineales bacterium]